MEKAIYFDMDGTIADLFGVKGWKESIDAEKVDAYVNAEPLYDKTSMDMIIEKLKKQGYVIGIITYYAYDATREFANKVRKAKKEWLNKYFPYADEIHIINHTTPKWKAAKIHNAILVDDAKANREEWRWGKTINAYKANIIDALSKIEE